MQDRKCRSFWQQSDDSLKMVRTRKIPRFVGKARYWRKVMLFDRVALERHDNTATRAERLQNAKRGYFVWLTGPKSIFDSEKDDAHLAEKQQSLRPIRPEHQQRQRQDQQFEGGENFDYYVDRKTGSRYYREPRRNPSAASSSTTSKWQTSWSSWQPTSSDEWW